MARPGRRARQRTGAAAVVLVDVVVEDCVIKEGSIGRPSRAAAPNLRAGFQRTGGLQAAGGSLTRVSKGVPAEAIINYNRSSLNDRPKQQLMLHTALALHCTPMKWTKLLFRRSTVFERATKALLTRWLEGPNDGGSSHMLMRQPCSSGGCLLPVFAVAHYSLTGEPSL